MGSSWVCWSEGGQPVLWLKVKEQKMDNQERKSQGDIAWQYGSQRRRYDDEDGITQPLDDGRRGLIVDGKGEEKLGESGRSETLH